MRVAPGCQVVVGAGVLVGAVGGTTVGAGGGAGGLLVGTVAAVLGEPVDGPPAGAVAAVDSWLGAAVVVWGVGARVTGVRTTWVLRGAGVPAVAGRTQ